MKTTHRLPLLVVATALAAGASACGSSPEDQAVKESFQDFLDGLDRADGPALWALADDETRQFFDDLAREIREAQAQIDTLWPEAERVDARRAIGGDFVGGGTTGASLFQAMLDPRRLKAPRDPDARRIVEIRRADSKATVILKSGDMLDFAADASGKWRTNIFLAPARELPGVVTLRENLATVRANAAVLSAGDNGHSPRGGPQ